MTAARTSPRRREGDLLRVGREDVTFGRNILLYKGSAFKLQHRMFVNDPWELLAEAITRAVKDRKAADIAHSFRRQAADYFRAATGGRELAVKPVLLYYGFLNLSKAYGLVKGNNALAGTAVHGLSGESNRKQIPESLVKFSVRQGTLVFQELLKLLGGNATILNSPLMIGHLLPQILPGHRLWCYATNRRERFLTVEKFEVRHDTATRAVWLNLFISRHELGRLNLSISTVLLQADLADFEVIHERPPLDLVCLQQKAPETYSKDPAEALAWIIEKTRNRFWETVKTASPYRKPYIYCSPPVEHGKRLPQLLSIYVLMFFLGYVTRYFPGHFEDFLDSRYGPFFDTFISESPMQFLYLMASEILGREVSKPAII